MDSTSDTADNAASSTLAAQNDCDIKHEIKT